MLVKKNFVCCSGSTFTARTDLDATRIHVRYHNEQHARGRRGATVTILTKEV